MYMTQTDVVTFNALCPPAGGTLTGFDPDKCRVKSEKQKLIDWEVYRSIHSGIELDPEEVMG